MPLEVFLRDPSAYVARERLLFAKVAFELKLIAARDNAQLQITEPEIDNIGHDFFASIDFNGIYLQNKSVLSDASTDRWEVHCKFLQTSFENRDIAPKIDTLPVGLEGGYGGVLLHEVDMSAAANDDLLVRYSYFDINLANLVRQSVISLPGFSPKEADDLLRELTYAGSGARVTLKRAWLLPITGIEAIAALRMHIGSFSNWMSLGGQDGLAGPLGQHTAREVAFWTRTE